MNISSITGVQVKEIDLTNVVPAVWVQVVHLLELFRGTG